MSLTEAQRAVAAAVDAEFMRPRSPRPLQPSKDYRPRLRPAANIRQITEHRALNPVNFPHLAECLDDLIEAGASLSGSDSDEDSDYELPPPRYHREGKELPREMIAYYNRGVAESAKELEERPLSPVSDTEYFGRVIVEPEPESDKDLDSPSRQLKEELSQMSQSESPFVGEVEDPLAHPEVLLFIRQSPQVPSSNSADITLKPGAQATRSNKRRRLA